MTSTEARLQTMQEMWDERTATGNLQYSNREIFAEQFRRAELFPELVAMLQTCLKEYRLARSQISGTDYHEDSIRAVLAKARQGEPKP